ncbi:hypothetical protein H4R33_007106, partial [Dimargaris cristalligena]
MEQVAMKHQAQTQEIADALKSLMEHVYQTQSQPVPQPQPEPMPQPQPQPQYMPKSKYRGPDLPKFAGHLQDDTTNQFRNLSQTGGVQSYVTSFTNLLAKCPEMHEYDRLAYFIQGLKHRILSHVAAQLHTSVEMAIKSAFTFEQATFKNMTPGFQKNFQPRPPNNPIPMDLGVLNKLSPAKCHSGDKDTFLAQAILLPASSYKLTPAQSIPTNTTRNTKGFGSTDHVLLTTSPDTHSSEPATAPLFTLTGLISGKTVKVLFDTGASCNFISHACAQLWQLPLLQTTHQRLVKAANNQTIQIKHFCTFSLTINLTP